MTPQQKQANQYLSQFGKRVRASLALKNGVCVLNDSKGDKIAIIEVPGHGAHAIFLCPVLSLHRTPSSALLSRLLMMNMDLAAMQGGWLALDDGEICLCYMLVLDAVNEESFCHELDRFIKQIPNIRQRLKNLSEKIE